MGGPLDFLVILGGVFLAYGLYSLVRVFQMPGVEPATPAKEEDDSRQDAKTPRQVA
jgi:hypothetical protein